MQLDNAKLAKLIDSCESLTTFIPKSGASSHSLKIHDGFIVCRESDYGYKISKDTLKRNQEEMFRVEGKVYMF